MKALDRTSNGQMPETPSIPEIPEHRLLITGENGWRELYVTSDHEEVRILSSTRQHTIIECGICGHTSADCDLWMAEVHAEMGHEDHFQRKHIGTKIVWLPDGFPGNPIEAAKAPALRESLSLDEENEWDQWVWKATGDCPDEKVAEIAAGKLDDPPSAFLIEHQPPREPYPGSSEEGGLPSFRFVEVPDAE